MVRWVVVQLALVNLFANSAYSCIAPFFPLEAAKKGVPESVIGFIFSGYSVAMVILSPLIAKYMHKLGRKNVIVAGLALEGTAMLLFAFVSYIDGAMSYAIVCFSVRLVEGAGNASLSTASFAMVASKFPNDLSNVIGII